MKFLNKWLHRTRPELHMHETNDVVLVRESSMYDHRVFENMIHQTLNPHRSDPAR